jgi:hypothetical protein
MRKLLFVLAAAFAGVLAAPAAHAQTDAAYAAVARPFDIARLHPEVRNAAEQGRESYFRAQRAAARARFDQPGTVNFVGTGGDRYDGEGFNDVRHGYGVNSWNDGEHHGGPYEAAPDGTLDFRVGYGVYVFADGRRYEGQFERNAFSGYGVIWNSNGSVQSAGIFRENELAQALAP